MKPGFEKEFADIQIGLIALCLEAVSEPVDKVYAYAYIGEGSSTFNAFFEHDGSIVPAHKAVRDSDLLLQVMKLGAGDLEKLRSVCAEYETKCPAEMRMCYNCRSKKFTADYNYKTNVRVDFSPHDSFLQWRKETAAAKVEE